MYILESIVCLHLAVCHRNKRRNNILIPLQERHNVLCYQLETTCASIRAGTFVFSLVFIKIKAAFTDIYVSVDPWVHAGLTRRCTASCIRGVFVFFVQWPLRTKHITVKAQTLRRCAPNPHIQTSRDGNALASLLLLDEKIVLHSFPACFVYVLIFFTSCSYVCSLYRKCSRSTFPAAYLCVHILCHRPSGWMSFSFKLFLLCTRLSDKDVISHNA